MMGFLIIDDHPLFGEALGNAIRISHPDARIYEATSIKGALGILASEPNIDLALLDLLLPDVVGFSGFQKIRDRHPRLPIAIVSSEEDKHTIREALEMGAVGYLPKSTSLGELSQAIARVLSGSVSAPRDFVAVGALEQSETARTLRERIQKLTPQQIRVLHLIIRGLQNREIASELKLAESTVKAHVTEILRKLKLFSRNKAIIELGMNFGIAARDQQAARLFEIAAESAPTVALPQYLYGHFLINHRAFERGLSYVDRALAIDPLQAEHHVGRGFGLLGQGRIEEAVAAYRRAGELDPGSAGIAGTLLFALQHKPGVTRGELLREHQRWAMLYRPSAPLNRLAFANVPDPARKPRLGLVSADLHRHAVSFLVLRAFEALAALGYEICCYKTDSKRQDDDFSERYKEISLSWRDVSGMDDQALGQQIAEDRIDVLFDLAGHTAGNRLSLFAMRAAPIQLSWAGYVGTVGLDTYDGLIADPVEIPPEHDASYIERPIRLPDCYVCYHPPAKAPEVPPLPSLSGGRFTFGCFNRPAKLNSELGKAWARILEQVPDSRILMVYGGLGETSTRDAVYNVLGQGGMPRERVELVGETEQDKLLVAYGEVDVALDPFPYSAGVTTLEAMWMGVPTVTFVGDTFAGRHSAAHLTAAGLGSFCAHSIDDYVAMAVGWTRRRDELAELRRTLRDRVAASPLCDAPRFADNLSRELMKLWAEWCEARTNAAA